MPLPRPHLPRRRPPTHRAHRALGIAALALLGPGCSDYNFNGKAAPSPEPEVEAAPAIRAAPEALDLGVLQLGGPAVEGEIALRSVGDADLLVSGLRLSPGSNGFTLLNEAPGPLAPGQSAPLRIRFDPAELGVHEDNVIVQSDDPARPTLSLPLRAEVVDPGVPSDTAVVEPPACACPEGFTARPDDSECAQRVESAAVWLGERNAACPILPYFAYGNAGARWPGGAVSADTYWGGVGDYTTWRLNTVGVWTCDATGTTAGTEPVGEWIGFAVCVDIAEPGSYLVGLGADNRMRFSLDGVMVFEDTDDATQNFNYWWLTALPISAGKHVVELEGYNAGYIAAFGAELSGPFPIDAPTDDASLQARDYAGQLKWSTRDSIGAAFDIGERAGWVCPDGTAYDACADEPLCFSENTAPCE